MHRFCRRIPFAGEPANGIVCCAIAACCCCCWQWSLLQQLLVLLHLGVELRRLERLLGELLDAGHDGRLDLRRRHHGHRCRALLRLKDLRLLHWSEGEPAAMPALAVPRPRWNLCEDWVGPLTHRARRSTGV